METQEILQKLKDYPVAVAGFVGTIVLAAYLYFTSGSVELLNTQFDELTKKADLVKANSISAVNLDGDLALIEATVEEIENRLMDSDAKGDNFKYFLELAEQSGVKLSDPPEGVFEDIGKGSTLRTELYGQIEYSLNVSGSYDSVLKFIYELTRGKHFVSVSSLSIRPALSEGLANVQSDIQIKTLAKSKAENDKGKKKKS